MKMQFFDPDGEFDPMTMIAQAEGVMGGTFPNHVMLIHIQTL